MDIALRIHYLLVAYAGNLANQHVKDKHLTLAEVQELILSTYRKAVHAFFEPESPLYPQVERPPGMHPETLLNMKGDTLTGVSLWRKYGEMKTYVLKYINPFWVRYSVADEESRKSSTDSSTRSVDDVYLKIRQYLWKLKEEHSIRKRPRRGLQPFNHDWYPKEWFVFIYCGFPAGNQALAAFTVMPPTANTLAFPRQSMLDFQLALSSSVGFETTAEGTFPIEDTINIEDFTGSPDESVQEGLLEIDHDGTILVGDDATGPRFVYTEGSATDDSITESNMGDITDRIQQAMDSAISEVQQQRQHQQQSSMSHGQDPLPEQAVASITHDTGSVVSGASSVSSSVVSRRHPPGHPTAGSTEPLLPPPPPPPPQLVVSPPTQFFQPLVHFPSNDNVAQIVAMGSTATAAALSRPPSHPTTSPPAASLSQPASGAMPSAWQQHVPPSAANPATGTALIRSVPRPQAPPSTTTSVLTSRSSPSSAIVPSSSLHGTQHLSSLHFNAPLSTSSTPGIAAGSPATTATTATTTTTTGTSPGHMRSIEELSALRHMLAENNALMRYDLEWKRLEKLLQRAIALAKPPEEIARWQQLLDEHLERNLPPPVNATVAALAHQNAVVLANGAHHHDR